MQPAKVGPPTMTIDIHTKSQLRSLMRAKRKAVTDQKGTCDFLSENLKKLLTNLLLKDKKLFSVYRSVGSECDVMNSAIWLEKAGAKLCLPCAASKEEELSFRLWNTATPLARSPLGFEQPAARAQVVVPDVILTPLLAFDGEANRLGQGAGHYDRAFARFPDAIRIGIAWDQQEVDRVPCDPWDIPLDAVATETRLIIPVRSRLNP